MEFFIKKIFEGKPDGSVHLQFEKFSRGEFKDKAMISAKNSKGKFSINTSHEYANELVRCLAEKIRDKTSVTGVVVTTRDLRDELDFQDKKQFAGVKQYIINKEMTKEEIMGLCDKFPKAFMGLSFKAGDSELKIKPKAPKSGKPSTKGEDKPKIDFCKLKTTDLKIIESLIFDEESKNFKQIYIIHDFIINDIVMPSEAELKGEKDFAKIRELAKRKGKIVRKLDIDEKKIKKEVEFVA